MRHFKVSEFDCPCCGDNDVDFDFAHKLDKARESACMPFVVNSGCRCEEHNASIGGSATSSHLISEDRPVAAADIACRDSHSRFLILRALLEHGFHRVGIGPDYIHVDDDTSKARGLIWLEKLPK